MDSVLMSLFHPPAAPISPTSLIFLCLQSVVFLKRWIRSWKILMLCSHHCCCVMLSCVVSSVADSDRSDRSAASKGGDLGPGDFWPVRPKVHPIFWPKKNIFLPSRRKNLQITAFFSRTTVLWSTIEPPIITPQQFYGVNTLQNAHCASSPVSPRARVIHLWQSSSLGLKFKTSVGRCEHFHSSRSYCQIETEQMSMWSSRSSWRSSTRCSPWLSSDSPQKLPVGTHAAITKVSF